MASNDYKILLFMKRRPGMTMDEFVDYYENRHVPLAMKYASRMSGYTRRYLTPQPTPETGQTEELPYDVITELCFEDETAFRRSLEYITTSVMPDEIVQDEKQLFDRAKRRIATVVERESRVVR